VFEHQSETGAVLRVNDHRQKMMVAALPGNCAHLRTRSACGWFAGVALADDSAM